MNIQQLKDAIAANSNILKAYFPPDVGMTDHQDYFFIKLYEKREGNLAEDRSYCIIVRNKGTESEEIFFKGSMPQSMQEAASSVFRDKVEAFLVQYQTTHADLKHWEYSSVDEAKKVIRLIGYVLIAPDLVPKQYFAWENGSGALQFYPIKA